MNIPLRVVLVTTFTALVIGAVGTVGTLSYSAGQRAVTTLAGRLMTNIGERIEQCIVQSLRDLRGIVESNAALIQQGLLDPGDASALDRHFATQMGLHPGVDSVGLITEQREFLMVARHAPDALMIRRFNAATDYRLHHYRADPDGRQGDLIESRLNYDPHNDPPGRPWYPLARDAGQGSWHKSVSLAKGQSKPELVSFYARPFNDASGRLRGVLAAGMTLTGLGAFLQELGVGTQGEAFVVDRQGMLVATSSGAVPFDGRARADHADNVAVDPRRLPAAGSADAVIARATTELLAREPALSDFSGALDFSFDLEGRDYFVKVAPLSADISHPDWLILVVAPRDDFTGLVRAQLLEPILFTGLVLLIAVLLGLAAAGLISRPLRELSAATRRLAAGDFSEPLPLTFIRELRDLGESFGRMTRRLRSAFGDLDSLNQTLQVTQTELADHNRLLEQRVEERTLSLLEARRHIADAMAQVAASEAKFRGMFEQSPLGIVLVDPATGTPLEINDRFLQIIGRTREDLLDLGWKGITHPDDLAKELEYAARLRAGVISCFQIEKRYVRPDGALVWVDLTVASMANGAKDRLLHLCLVEDISSRQMAEEALRESEERFRMAFNNVITGMCLVDLQGNLVRVNNEMTVIFGYAQQEMEGMTVNDLAFPEDVDVSSSFIRDAIQGNRKSAIFEKRYRHRQGHVIHGLVASSLVCDAKGQPAYFISQIQDISERKRYERNLQEARETAEKANAAKSEFLAHMTHELRTPLHAILGFAEMLSRWEERDGARLAPNAQTQDSALLRRRGDLLAAIQRNGRDLLALVNDVLDLGRMERGLLRLEPRPMDLQRLLHECVADCAALAEDKQLALSLDVDSGLPRALLADARRLKQILNNLLGNAVKFTQHGQVMFQATATPDALDSERITLRLTVADTGPGIPQAEQETIFDAFTQGAGGPDKVAHRGSGIGLAISRTLARQMGGEISLFSEVGHGSRFTLVLPSVPLANPVEVESGSVGADDSGHQEASTASVGMTQVSDPAPPSRLRAPPDGALSELRELAELGRTTRLEAWCDYWSAPRRRPVFAAEVLRLTHAFAHERIIALVDACRDHPAGSPCAGTPPDRVLDPDARPGEDPAP